MWEEVKKWFKHSVTILWARIKIVAGIVGGVVVALVTDPTFQVSLHQFVAEYWWLCLIVLGIITELARRRTAKE